MRGRTAFVRRTIWEGWEGWEGQLKWGAAPARDARQGALAAMRNKGSGTAAQGAWLLAQQIHYIQHALRHVHQLQALVHGRLAQLFVGGLFGQALALH